MKWHLPFTRQQGNPRRANCPEKQTGCLPGPFQLKFIIKQTYTKLPQSCPTLCNTMNWNPPGSSVHGILQARILEWVAIYVTVILYFSMTRQHAQHLTPQDDELLIAYSCMPDIICFSPPDSHCILHPTFCPQSFLCSLTSAWGQPMGFPNRTEWQPRLRLWYSFLWGL